jgi:hypothetical protein
MKFTDAKGRDWTLAINNGSIKAVRQKCDVDLADPTYATLNKMASDFVLLVDVLWVLCEQQAANKQPPVSPEDFGEALVGDPIDAACAAMEEAIAGFFPRQKRLLLQQASAKARQAREKGEELALTKLSGLDMAAFERATEARLEAEIQAALTRLSSPTNLQDKLA